LKVGFTQKRESVIYGSMGSTLKNFFGGFSHVYRRTAPGPGGTLFKEGVTRLGKLSQKGAQGRSTTKD